MQKLEFRANKAIKSQELVNQLAERHGKLTSAVYKLHHEESQKTLKLYEMQEYLSGDTTDYQTQTRNVNNKIKSTFETNQQQLPRSTRIKIRGQDKKKIFFILAFFSTTASSLLRNHQASACRYCGLSRLCYVVTIS